MKISQEIQYLIKNHLFIIIPARNEEKTLPYLIKNIQNKITSKIIVVDNSSSDLTSMVSEEAGAIVISEKRIGYGYACIKGIKYAVKIPIHPKFICFFDGDGQSDYNDIISISYPVLNGWTNYNQGSRMIKHEASINLTRPAIIANRFYSKMLQIIWRQRISDLGPLRCINVDLLEKLDMKSKGFGWTMEMTAKILKSQSLLLEMPVNYSKRLKGQSKISGNLKTAIKAAFIIGLTLINVLFFWSSKIEPNN